MTIRTVPTNAFKTRIFNSSIALDLINAPMKFALFNSNADLVETTATYTEQMANEVTSPRRAYPVGGNSIPVGNLVRSIDFSIASPNTLQFKIDIPVWSNVEFTTSGGMLYFDNASKDSIACYSFGGPVTVYGDFLITIPTGGSIVSI